MLKKILFIQLLFILLLSGCAGQPPAAPEASPQEAFTPTEPAPTQTQQATLPVQATAIPTQTPAELPPSATPEPTATPLPYRPQLGSPQYLPAFTHPESGCNWVGIAGQVFDNRANPVENVTVVVKGYFDGKPVNEMALSGLGKAYGPGGFEVKLGEKALKTQGAVTVQLFNDKFEPLSRLYQIDTYNDCQKNLIIFNFQGIMTVQYIYLPILVK